MARDDKEPCRGIVSKADIDRLEEMPLASRRLPQNVLEALRQGSQHCQGRDALVFLPDAKNLGRVFRFSYASFISRVEDAASAFMGLAEQTDPVVSIILPNLPETHFALWGSQMAGKANPINPLLEAEKMADIMKGAGADIVITLAPVPGVDIFDKAVRAARLAGVQHIVTVNAARYTPALKRMIGTAIAAWKSSRSGVGAIHDFHTLCQSHKGRGLPDRLSGDIGALFHTGGTTGSPKIAQLTHGNQVFVSWAAAKNRFMERNRSIFCGLPLFHVNGALVTGLVSWMNGATVVLGPPQGYRSPGLIENFWNIVERFEIGAMSGVPAVYKTLLDQPIGKTDVSSLEFGIVGAAPIAAHTIETFQDRTGLTLLEGYGFTEGACISTINPGYGQARLGSVGLPIPYQDLKILTGDYAEPVEAQVDEIGRICARGPNIFTGYADAQHDAAAWITFDGRRYYDSGDLGRLDRDGYLWLAGRSKDLIIRGGHNIDPAMIEDAFTALDTVAMVAALGSPDLRVGEVPVVYVVPEPGWTGTAAELLEQGCCNIPERAAFPRFIRIVDELPMTAVGKVFKPELRAWELGRVCRAILEETFAHIMIDVDTHLTPEGQPSVDIGVTQEAHQDRVDREDIERCLAPFGALVNVTMR